MGDVAGSDVIGQVFDDVDVCFIGRERATKRRETHAGRESPRGSARAARTRSYGDRRAARDGTRLKLRDGHRQRRARAARHDHQIHDEIAGPGQPRAARKRVPRPLREEAEGRSIRANVGVEFIGVSRSLKAPRAVIESEGWEERNAGKSP